MHHRVAHGEDARVSFENPQFAGFEPGLYDALRLPEQVWLSINEDDEDSIAWWAPCRYIFRAELCSSSLIKRFVQLHLLLYEVNTS